MMGILARGKYPRATSDSRSGGMHARRGIKSYVGECGAESANSCVAFDALDGKVTTEGSRARDTGKESEDVAGDGVQTRARRKLALNVRHERFCRGHAGV